MDVHSIIKYTCFTEREIKCVVSLDCLYSGSNLDLSKSMFQTKDILIGTIQETKKVSYVFT